MMVSHELLHYIELSLIPFINCLLYTSDAADE